MMIIVFYLITKQITYLKINFFFFYNNNFQKPITANYKSSKYAFYNTIYNKKYYLFWESYKRSAHGNRALSSYKLKYAISYMILSRRCHLCFIKPQVFPRSLAITLIILNDDVLYRRVSHWAIRLIPDFLRAMHMHICDAPLTENISIPWSMFME